MSGQPSLDFGRYKGRPVADVPTRVLKRYHGELQGRNTIIADELRRRGLSSTELREIEWEHSQSLWRRSAQKAAKIRVNVRRRERKWRKRQARRRRIEQRVEAQRQAHRAVYLHVEQGFTVVGENFVETQDGTCPFGDG